MLLVVGTRGEFSSNEVRDELGPCRNLGRAALPIDFGGALENASKDAVLLLEVLKRKSALQEARGGCREGPSLGVVEEIRRSFDLVRQEAKRLWFFVATTAVLASLAVSAGAPATLAINARAIVMAAVARGVLL